MARELQQRAKVQRQLTDSAPCDAFCIGSVDSKAESPALQMMRAASDMEARVVDGIFLTPRQGLPRLVQPSSQGEPTRRRRVVEPSSQDVQTPSLLAATEDQLNVAHRLNVARRQQAQARFAMQRAEHLAVGSAAVQDSSTQLEVVVDPQGEACEQSKDLIDWAMEQLLVRASRVQMLSAPADGWDDECSVGATTRRGEIVHAKQSAGCRLCAAVVVRPRGSDVPSSQLPREDSFLYVEHLRPRELDQSGFKWFGLAFGQAWDQNAKLTRQFHEGDSRREPLWKQAHDVPAKDHANTIDLGWSVYAGSGRQQSVTAGIAYARTANVELRDAAQEKDDMLMQYALDALLPIAWNAVELRFPRWAKRMWNKAERFRLRGTGFSKISLGCACAVPCPARRLPVSVSLSPTMATAFALVADDNPCVAHFDKNWGIDVIIALSINELKGGHHVMLSFDGQHAIVVETSPDGTLIIGTHAARAHGFTCARATTERGVLSPRAQAITRRCCTATWRRTTAAASSPHST